MRILSSAAQTVLQGQTVPLVGLVEMDLTQQLLLNTASLDLTINGVTYLGTRGLGKVDTVKTTAGEIAPLRLEMSGIPSASLAVALAEPVQGKAVRFKLALLDPATLQPLDVQTIWTGRLDVMAISHGTDTATISVSAEHVGIDLLRPLTSLYTDAEQRRLAPGDLFCQFVSTQAEQQVVWPAASWGRK